MDKQIERTLDQLSGGISENQTEENQTEKAYGVFSSKDIQQLKSEYKEHYNAEKSLREICASLFRNAKIRTLGSLAVSESRDDQKKEEDIKTAFYAIQEIVVTKTTKKEKKIHHKKGDFILDSEGKEIPAEDGRGCKTYQENTIEIVDELVDSPYYDYKNNSRALNELKKFIETQIVAPDFNVLERRLCKKIDFDRGMDIIREIAKYYIFED